MKITETVLKDLGFELSTATPIKGETTVWRFRKGMDLLIVQDQKTESGDYLWRFHTDVDSTKFHHVRDIEELFYRIAIDNFQDGRAEKAKEIRIALGI